MSIEIILEDLLCVEDVVRSLLRILPKIATYIWKTSKRVKAAKKRRRRSLKVYTLDW